MADDATLHRVIEDRNRANSMVQSLLERLHDKASNDHQSRACDFAALLQHERNESASLRTQLAALDEVYAQACAEREDLRNERDAARKEVAFWQEQQKLAANVAATIADLDETAPALRQMLRQERARREDEERRSLLAEAERDAMRPVVEAAKAYVAANTALARFRPGDDLGALADAQATARNRLIGAVDITAVDSYTERQAEQ